MQDKLIIAIPSKGRLEEKAAALFDKAGVGLKRDAARGYTGHIVTMEAVEIAYLSASEIATRLRDGSVHIGITGEDLLREEVSDMDSTILLLKPLGFGHANVVVAIPDGWRDVTHMSDLAEVAGDFRSRHGQRLRVATKYFQLTQDFFALHGITDYTIVRSFGATEGAPASGAAEIIVDITSTGATLTANQLRIPDDGVILRSEANLTASLTADWSASARAAIRKILHRLEARSDADKMVELTFETNSADEIWLAELCKEFGATAIGNIDTLTNGSLCVVLNKSAMAPFCEALHQKGKAIVTARDASHIFSARNEIFDRLLSRLPA